MSTLTNIAQLGQIYWGAKWHHLKHMRDFGNPLAEYAQARDFEFGGPGD